MAKSSQSRSRASSSSESEPPKDFASVPPTQTPMIDHSFTLQAILQNQQTLGELKGLIKGMEETIKSQGTKIDKHGNIIAFATGAITIAIIVAGFLIDKLWDKVYGLITMNIHAP